MSDEQLKYFLAAVKADTACQEELNASEYADAVLAIAQEAWYNIAAEGVIGLEQ